MDFYTQEINSPSGEKISMQDFEGKVILIVNTATQCGLTPQFDGLEELYQKYKDQGLVVIGTPCNQFGFQEPLENDVMTETCRINHGVTFPLTEKIKVNGPDAHDLYKYLKSELGSLLGSSIKWNFTKFLINKEGKPYKRYKPTTDPSVIEEDIVALLEE